MDSFLRKIKKFFTEHPLFYSAIQVSSCYLSGMRITHKERVLKDYFILPLPLGIIQPSFNKTNITDPDLLEKTITQGVKNMEFFNHGMALLLPELSQRTFVFDFESLPLSSKEKEQLIRFKVRKQMPLLVDDTRMSFDVIEKTNKKTVVSSIASASVVNEFEGFFSRWRFKIQSASIPILSLSNLIDWNSERDFLLVNVEEDVFGLLAVLDADLFLYRQKPFLGRGSYEDVLGKIQNIVQEIENTAHFIEDKEKRNIESVWVRLGMVKAEKEMMDKLKSRVDFRVKNVESLVKLDLSDQEKKVLAPLAGQIL